MDHVAIMKASWRLLEKIVSGDKTIESRWYKTKHLPWGRVTENDTVYFKNSGRPITVKATVSRILSFQNLTPQKVRAILLKYGRQDGISDLNYFYNLFKAKNYCLLIFLKDIKKVKPFEIDKKGFGTMSAWITLNDIDIIRKQNRR